MAFSPLPPPASGPVRLRVKLAIAAASLVFTLAAAELVARGFGLGLPLVLIPSSTNCLRRSALLGVEFRPDCAGWMDGVPFATNTLGLRGPQVANDGSLRILAAGDSCTFGWAVAEAEAYPARLQNALDHRGNTPRYQVINAGVPGYTSYQGLVYLRERGLALRPTVVLIDYGFNDTFTTGEIEEQLARARLTTPFLTIDDTLIDYSRFYRWLRWQAIDVKNDSTLPVRVSPERYEHNLRAMIEAAQGAGAQVVLLSFWSPIGPHKAYRLALTTAAEATGVPVVRYNGPKLDIVHPTTDGYRILSDAIAARLVESGYVH